MSTTKTPHDLWNELEPAYQQLAALIKTAPLDVDERAGLGICFLTHALTVAAALHKDHRGGKGSIESHAHEVAGLVLKAVFSGKQPDLKVVK